MKDLIFKEQFYINQLNPTYNILLKVNFSIGYKHTEENKLLFSGKNHPLFGKSHNKESKKKISNSLKGLLKSEETKNKIS